MEERLFDLDDLDEAEVEAEAEPEAKASTRPTGIIAEDIVTDFSITLEERARASTQTSATFVEPAAGTLARALSNHHHIVFGRRGSGKTSLLQKTRQELVVERRPVAYVDMEKYKGHEYPDVLISVLIECMQGFHRWLTDAAVAPANKTSFWKQWFSQPRRKPLSRKAAMATADKIAVVKAELEELLHATDDASLERTQAAGSSSEVSGGVKAKARGVGAEVSGTEASTVERSETEQFRRNKTLILRRNLLRYQEALTNVRGLSEGDGIIILDDLYHLPRVIQADVLDYFHSISKGAGIWLKVGTLKYRSSWYRHGDPSVGMKLGDDADSIDLDLSLEKYRTAKDFLFRLLDEICEEYDISVDQLMNPGAKDRLVLASGGVARDFLSVLRGAISEARETRDDRINAKAVYRAAAAHDTTKRDELQKDTLEGADDLENEFSNITNFCVARKKNIFLVEKDLGGPQYDRIKQLVDLRLLHTVAGRVKAFHRENEIYEAYMLDLSQYVGDRKRRDLEMLPFWKQEAKDRIRGASRIYAERSKQNGATV